MKHLYRALAALGLTLLPASPAHAADGESSFTPQSFIMPIYSVMLARGLDTNIPLYSCTPGSSGDAADAGPAGDAGDAGVLGDCNIDMADENALANLFSQAVDIPAGTYDRIVVFSCAANSAFQARVKGSVELEGTTYYTTSGDPVISTNPADLDYASINYSGCGNTIMFPQPLNIAAGDDITVSAFFTLQNLSWVLENSSPGLGGCAVAPAGDPNVCSGLPVLVAYLGDAAPTLDSYFITEDTSDLLAAKAGGQVMLLSSGGEPFSGFLRRVYSHDSTTPSVSYDVPLRDITRNPDEVDAGLPLADAGPDAGSFAASYDIYAIGDPFQDLTKYRVRFPRFELRDHVGTLVTANGGGEVQYRAVKR